MQSANHPDSPPLTQHCSMPALSSLNHVPSNKVPSSPGICHPSPFCFLLITWEESKREKRELEVQLTQCVTTVVDVALLTLSHASAPPQKSKSQSTDRELLSTAGTHCKQINARLNDQIPYRTKNNGQQWIISKNTARTEAQKIVFRLWGV